MDSLYAWAHLKGYIQAITVVEHTNKYFSLKNIGGYYYNNYFTITYNATTNTKIS